MSHTKHESLRDMGTKGSKAPAHRKVLVIGHGRWYTEVRSSEPEEFRCSPFAPGVLEALIVPTNDVVMVDHVAGMAPDILLDVKIADWTGAAGIDFDLVVEAISHLALDVRSSRHFWTGVHAAMKEGTGEYVGWHEHGQFGSTKYMVVRLNRSQVADVLAAHEFPSDPRQPRLEPDLSAYAVGDRQNRYTF